MTEYELESLRQETLQSVMAIVDVQATHVSIYLTIVFAYIIVAYIAGSNLTRFQLVIATLIFVAACLWELIMITTLGQGATEVGREMFQSADVQPILDESARKWFIRILWSLGMLAALVFMWSVRHPRAD